MSGKTHADIPLSFFEYRAVYREPIFDFHKLYGEVSQAVFRAFREWNVSLENVSHKQNPLNFSEVSTTFSLFGGRLAFNVGLGASGLLVTNPSWSEADLISKIANAGVEAVQSGTGVVIEKHRASIAMHVRPITGSIKQYVSNLARLGASESLGGDVRAYGISVYREDSTWVVDKSASYHDALFVRIEQILGPQISFEQLAARLKDDEMKLLGLLKLEVE